MVRSLGAGAFVAALVVALLASSPPSADAAAGRQWEVTDLVGAGGARVGVSGDGRTRAQAWLAGVSGARVARLRHTTDDGATWAEADISDPSRDASSPRVSVSGDGRTILLAWLEREGQDNKLSVRWSADAGASWGQRRFAALGTRDAFPAIDLSGDGAVLAVVWQRIAASGSVTQTAYSTDAGDSWKRETRSGPHSFTISQIDGARPDVAVSSDGGTIALAYVRRGDDGFGVIRSDVSRDGGDSWQARDISVLNADSRRPQVDVSADGTTLGFGWTRFSTRYQGYIARAHIRGPVRTRFWRLSTQAVNAVDTRVGVSGPGSTIAFAWTEQTGAAPRVSNTRGTVSFDGGLTWDPRELTNSSNVQGDSPSVAVSDAGPVAFTWRNLDRQVVRTRYTDGPGDIWVERDVARRDIASARQEPLAPVSAISGDGSVLAFGWYSLVNNSVRVATGAWARPPAPTATPAPSPTNAPTGSPTAPATPPTQSPPTGGSGPGDSAGVRRTRVKAKAVKARSRLKVRIKPDLGRKKQWRFVVKERSKGNWRTVTNRKGKPKVYRTKGRKHVRTINLDRGRYKVRSRAARGYQADRSGVVRLRR